MGQPFPRLQEQRREPPTIPRQQFCLKQSTLETATTTTNNNNNKMTQIVKQITVMFTYYLSIYLARFHMCYARCTHIYSLQEQTSTYNWWFVHFIDYCVNWCTKYLFDFTSFNPVCLYVAIKNLVMWLKCFHGYFINTKDIHLNVRTTRLLWFQNSPKIIIK